ncbi:MAG: Ig-like domain-containing protein [Firmicutes bacterium]|nr:Ig-like domain-containing protein [Bacillota bacterium]
MKRVSALVCAMIVAIAMMAPACLAVTDTTSVDPGFTIVSSSPKDGDEGVAVDNFSVKIYFSKEMMPKSAAIRKSNAAQFTLVDEDGKKVPLKVYYSEKEKKRGLMMVAADYTDNNKKNVQIKGASKYTLTIGDKLQATDGSKYNQTTKIQVTTLNQQRSMIVYMVLMVAMMGGMVFFTIRSTKKAEEKKKEEASTKGANPYKEAKKTGKSVEEIVAKNQKKRNKQEEAKAKQKEREAALEAEILEKMRREKNKRVKAPAPISAVGSTYKVQVKKTEKEPVKTNKGTTNPKNQSGKKKNAGKKKGKKK